MKKLPIIATAGFLLVGCGGPSASTTDATAPAPTRAAPRWTVVQDDPLAARMRTLSDSLARVGFRPTTDESRGFLVGGENTTVRVHVDQGSCVAFTAVTSPGIHDLDATMFSAEGDVLTEDVEEDSHPTAIVCAPSNAARDVYVALRAYDGAGAYLCAAFTGPEARLADVARAIGGQPGVAGNSSTDVQEDAREREFGIGASRRGLETMRDTVAITLAAGQAVRVPVQVEAGHCYAVAAFAGNGLRNVDLRMLDERDRELVRDVGPQGDSAVQFCADRASQWVAEVTASAGSGIARLTFYGGEAAQPGGLSTSWLGVAASSARSRTAAAQTLEPILADLSQHGYRVMTRNAARPIATGGVWEGYVTVPAQSCVAVVAASGNGLGRVTVLARAAGDARAVTSRTQAGELASTMHLCCDDAPQRYDLIVTADQGQGEIAVAYVAAPASLNDELRRGL
ncbi:MAG: hypothetical protein IPK60_02580 [Sandaracinaceae bacterium]|nr:hypothetical protein [Sandaracinaceae bacterium]